MKKLSIIALALCVSIIMVQPLMAGEPDTAVNKAVRAAGNEDGEASEQLYPGFYSGRPTDIYVASSGAYSGMTWCLMNGIWWGTSNPRYERMMVSAVGSRRVMAFNIPCLNCGWNYAKTYNY